MSDLHGGDPILDGLNPAQREAASCIEGPLLVLAGAGTGKTRVITHRIAAMIRRGIPAPAILGVTFTNKAAREMRHRVRRLVGEDSVRLGTFHGFCATFLREEFPTVGRAAEFTIYDEGDAKALLKQVLDELNLAPDYHTPAKIAARIGAWKAAMTLPEEALAKCRGTIEHDEARAYELYQVRLAAANACDFDDLLLQTSLILERHDDARARWQRRITHVLVDEFQDTNPVQYRLVRLLSPSGNLCATGDPDQSIYRWRGADPATFDRFLADHPGARVVPLEQNYRSTGHILAAASRLVAHNPNRLPKTLWTDAGDGEPVRVVAFDSDAEEAEAIAATVLELVEEGFDRREIAVFYRTNALSLPVERALLRRNVAYQVVGGMEFFGRQEVKDLLAYLRFLVNPQDVVSLMRIVNVPARGIGDRTKEQLLALARASGRPVGDVIRDATALAPLAPRAREAVLRFAAILECLLPFAGAPVRRLLDAVLEATGYADYWRDKATKGGSLDPHQNIGQLVNFAREFDDAGGGGASRFLEEVSLLTDVDRWDEEAGAVSLMTLHTSKGLEFDVVFVIGVEEGILPHAMTRDEDGGPAEERRLLHVGMTRARRRLVLTHARWRSRFGRPTYGQPSRFLSEIGRTGIEWYGDGPPAAAAGAALRAADFELEPEHHPLARLRKGSRVRHRDWGLGVVAAIRGRGQGLDRKVDVLFEGEVRRTLVLLHAELELVEMDEDLPW